MSETNPPDRKNAPPNEEHQSQTSVDPQQLSELVERAVELKESGDAAFVNTVLMQLDESKREEYRQPLLDRLTDDSSARPDEADGQATIEPESYQAPTVAPDLPEPSSKSGKGTRAPIPENIGKFKIKRELGRGACGAVYLGYDDELERYVAVKVSHVVDRQQQELLRVEASKLAQIESVGIVPVYHIGKTEYGELFIVEKYIQGTSLRELAKPGPLSPAMAVTLMREIALGLESAHVQDILHRDLKPDNILIEENGRPWIADFGLAINEEEQQIQSRQLAGTPPYMSPEQIIGKVDFLDARSDIWALGVMYYELLTGKLPFSGKDRKTLADQICERDPRPLQQRAPGRLTKEMNDIFLRCCAKQPSDRYATARELAHDLEKLIAHGPLDTQNIHGDTMVSRIGESMNEASASLFLSLYTTVGASQQFDQTRPEHESNLWLRVMTVAAVMGLTIAGIIAYQVYSGSAVVSAELPSPDPTIEAPLDPMILGSDDVKEFDPDQGSRLKPWVVAKNDFGTHNTVSAAIEASASGDVIKVMPGDYEESLRITKPVTIEGVIVDGETVEIRNDQRSPLTVDCPNGEVIIQDLEMKAEGRKNEFNAGEVVGGTLRLVRCKLRSDSFNCIKVRNGSTLATEDCVFFDSGEHAIVAVEGSKLELDTSTFHVPGVQLDGSDGVIKGCHFYGIEGIYVANSSEPVQIEDCEFEGKGNALVGYGIRSTNGGEVVAKRIIVKNYEEGLSAGRDERDDGPAGRIELKDAVKIEHCIYGIGIGSGATVLAEDECRSIGCKKIENCRFGVQIGDGNVVLSDFIISDIHTCGIFATDTADVLLNKCTIEDCDGTGIDARDNANIKLFQGCSIARCPHGIDLQSGELEMRGGRITNCLEAAVVFGLDVHSTDTLVRGRLDGVTFSGLTDFGILAYSGAITLKDVTISGGERGLKAMGPPLSRPSLTPVVGITAVDNVSFKRTEVHAVGDAQITLAVEVLDTLSRNGRAKQEQGGPARIVAPKNTAGLDDSENPFDRLD